jgi:hypothetical protein
LGPYSKRRKLILDSKQIFSLIKRDIRNCSRSYIEFTEKGLHGLKVYQTSTMFARANDLAVDLTDFR